MKTFVSISLFSGTLLLLNACNQTKTLPYRFQDASVFNQDSLSKAIGILASDEFMGRKPFTEGETKTVNYLKTAFQSIGLEPGNGDSYFQEVPMVNIATEAAPAMQVHSSKGNFQLEGYDDYVIWTDRDDQPAVTLDKNELVFAGYGVVAPEYGWNDYEGLDVKGKVVLVMVNDPGFGVDSSLFKGDTMTYYGRWPYKFEEAARQGAKGCLIVHTTKGASYPFSVVQNHWNRSKLYLDGRGKDKKQCDVIGWVSEEASKKLLEAAGMDSTLFAKANQRGFTPQPLNIQLSTSIKVTPTYQGSKNVIAKITGSKYPDEYIIYTAHWDHLGIGKPDEKGDSIYNGAVDNASGTAGLLKIARAFKSIDPGPQRTIIFLAVTAEEQGLWGSAYYTENPIYPLAKTVANINMDGLNYIGKTKDFIVIGRGQSELEDHLKEAAENQGRYIAFEKHPEAGFYYRSDHFNFAKVGVPALFTATGIDVIGKEKGYGQSMQDAFTNQHYHRPSDEHGIATSNLEGAIEDLKLYFEVGRRLASSRTWPKWKDGSEFKAVRDRSEAMRK